MVIEETGTYRLATGWYDPVTADRLEAIDAEGRPLLEDRAILGGEIMAP
jgi:hypothetical protein